MASALASGFADVPIDAAHTFRAALQAMARPGRIERVQDTTPPLPLSAAAGALLLTLCDPETPLHLAGDHDCTAVREWVTFHCGSPLIDRSGAAFAIGMWSALMPCSDYAIGTAEYPDRSATMVVEVDHLEPSGPRLTGPGIHDHVRLSLPETEAFQANAVLFPLGLDFFFTSGNRLAALPRTTRVEGA